MAEEVKVCPHGIRHPWACAECEANDPMPAPKSGVQAMSGEAVTVTQALKPCPFCGGKPDFHDDTHYGECDNCGCAGPDATREVDAVTLWNTRSQPAPTAGDELANALGNAADYITDCIFAGGAVRSKVWRYLNNTFVPAIRQSDAATIADLTARLAEAEAREGRRAAALHAAIGWFVGYAANHDAKGTAEGSAKAETNRSRAAYLRAALEEASDAAE